MAFGVRSRLVHAVQNDGSRARSRTTMKKPSHIHVSDLRGAHQLANGVISLDIFG